MNVCPFCRGKMAKGKGMARSLGTCVPCGVSWLDGSIHNYRRWTGAGWGWSQVPEGCLVVKEEREEA